MAAFQTLIAPVPEKAIDAARTDGTGVKVISISSNLKCNIKLDDNKKWGEFLGDLEGAV